MQDLRRRGVEKILHGGGFACQELGRLGHGLVVRANDGGNVRVSTCSKLGQCLHPVCDARRFANGTSDSDLQAIAVPARAWSSASGCRPRLLLPSCGPACGTPGTHTGNYYVREQPFMYPMHWAFMRLEICIHGHLTPAVVDQERSSAGCVQSSGSSELKKPSVRICSQSSMTLALSGSAWSVDSGWKLKLARESLTWPPCVTSSPEVEKGNDSSRFSHP